MRWISDDVAARETRENTVVEISYLVIEDYQTFLCTTLLVGYLQALQVYL